MKKALSIVLCIVMVLSMVSMTAVAAGEDVVLTVAADKQDANRGDTVTFTVTLAPISKGTASFSFKLDIPEGLTYVAGSAKFSDAVKTSMGAKEADNWEETGLLVAIYGLGDGYTATTNTEMLTFDCTVDADAKGAKSVGLKEVEFFDANDAAMTAASTPVSVTALKGGNYTPASIDMSYGALDITDKTAKTVTPANITGLDTEGDALPASDLATITYAFKGTAPAGLSIDAKTGKVTVTDAGAVVAGTVTVTATLGTTTVKKDVDITVTKAAAAPETVTVTGPTAAIIKADADQTYTFTATVKDQYGAEMAGQTIAWTTEPGTLPEGVSFAEGVLTVSKDTPAASKGDVKIIATVGGKTGNITTKVTDIEFPGLADAVKVAATATYGDKWSKIVTIPATFAGKAGETTVNGTLTLKYDGEEIPAAAEEGHAFQVIFNAEGFENVVAFEGKTPAIAKKPITIKANDVTVNVGADVAEIEYSYTADALVGADALAGTATYATFAMNEDGTKGEAASVSTEEPADYVVEVSGLTPPSENYELTFEAGTLTVKKKSSIAPAIGTGTKPGEATGGNGQKEPVVEMAKFEDVAEDDWFYGAVEFVVSKGLFKGTSETTFAPNANMNRAMVATVLFRLDGATKADVAAAFEDIEADTWYTDGVAWASEKEIVKGYSETVFAPNDNVTREQLAVMLYRYVGAPEVDAEMGMAGFNDVDAISEWAADAMRWAVQNGILVGKDGGMLDPAGNATRAEVATMLQRFVNLEK